MNLSRTYDRAADHGGGSPGELLAIRDAEEEYDRRRFILHQLQHTPKARI